jgi:hypothetical protein
MREQREILSKKLSQMTKNEIIEYFKLNKDGKRDKTQCITHNIAKRCEVLNLPVLSGRQFGVVLIYSNFIFDIINLTLYKYLNN